MTCSEGGSVAAPSKYAFDEDRRAAKAARQREYEQRKREEGDEWERTRRRKPSDPAYPPTRCACGCGQLLTVACVNGGSEYATRECAGFGTATLSQQATDDEPTADDLDGQPPAGDEG